MALPVLLLTHDDALYEHWFGLSAHGWAPVRGRRLNELESWSRRGVMVVMDARILPGADAAAAGTTDATGKISADIQLIVASMKPNDPEGQRALVAGAVGYVYAYMPAAGLDKVLRHVMAGEIWVGQSMLSRMLSQISQAIPETSQDWAKELTERERDVARYVALGHSNQSVATSLNISERTVRAHLSAIFAKLEVADRLALALKVHGVSQ